MSYELLFRDRAEIERVQRDHFRATMALVAERHPHYRDVMAARGLSARDFAELDDLARLPLTTKDEYMRAPERFVLDTAGLDEEMRVVWDTMYTTGSTAGKPTPFISTAYDFYDILSLQRNMLLLRGVTREDVIANLFPLTRAPHGAWIRALHAAASLNVRTVAAMPGNPSPHLTVGNGLDEVVRIVERSRATVLWGVPSYLARVAERAAELQADFGPVRMLLVTGEGLTEAAREALVAGLARVGARAHVSISYGSTELQGGMIECTPGTGYHNPAPEQAHVDIVDPVTHASVPDGTPGLVVLTHLRRRGTLLLRYSLGDISTRTRERCPHCGAWTDRLTTMPRRVDALVKVKGMLVNPDVLVQALEATLGAQAFRAIVRKDGDGPIAPDVLEVRVAQTAPLDTARAAEIAARVQAAVSVTPRVVAVAPDALVDPSAAWKTKKFADQRG